MKNNVMILYNYRNLYGFKFIFGKLKYLTMVIKTDKYILSLSQIKRSQTKIKMEIKIGVSN